MAFPLDEGGADSVVDATAALLRGRILTGELRAGEPLREQRLAADLGVSRNTVREALRALEETGLIDRVTHRGAAVRSLRPDDVRDCMRVRAIVESAAVNAAAQASDAARDRVAAALDAYAAVVGTGEPRDLVEADLAIHAALVASLESPRLDKLFATITGELLLAFMLQTQADLDDLARVRVEHAAIVGPFLAGDAARATAALGEHLGHTAKRVHELVSRPPAAPAPRRRRRPAGTTRRGPGF